MHCTLTALGLQFACNGGGCNLLPYFLLLFELFWVTEKTELSFRLLTLNIIHTFIMTLSILIKTFD